MVFNVFMQFLTMYFIAVIHIQGKLGELKLSLCFNPLHSTITINILEARQLKSKDVNGLSGNKCFLVHHSVNFRPHFMYSRELAQ